MAQVVQNMNIGDKVVCVDAGPNPNWPEYKSPLIPNAVYVVRAVKIAPNGQTGIEVIGLNAPKDFFGNIFNIRRFRLLSEMKNAVQRKATRA
jgi:hypothetical protein